MTFKQSGDDAVVTITKSGTSGTITLGGAGGYELKKSGNYIFAEPVPTIYAAKHDQKVTGTDHRDLLINTGFEGVSMQGGKGNDTYEGSIFGETFMFSYASGDDVVVNFGANDTVRSTSGTLSYEVSGDDVIVSIKKNSTVGTATLQGAAIYADNIKATNNALSVTGINVIENDKDNAKVTGEKGVDEIHNTGQNVTIQAGVGDDIIHGSDLYGDTFLFSYASGNDTIVNPSLGDTIKSTNGTLTYKSVGDDVLVTIKKGKTSGTVTLKDAATSYTVQKSDNNSIVLRPPMLQAIGNVPSEEDYWFLDEEAADSVTDNEVSAMISDADSDNSIGKLDYDPSDLLTSVGIETKFEQASALNARHKARK